MMKKFFAVCFMFIAMFIMIACNQEGDENIYNNPCCPNQPMINFAQGEDSPEGLILWGDNQNKRLMSIDITCEESETCTVYEMTFNSTPNILFYFSDFWLEDETNNIISEVVSPSHAQEIEFIFSSNIELSETKKIYLAGLLVDASSPGVGLWNSFVPRLHYVDASATTIGLPLEGNSIYAEYEEQDILFTSLSPSSPSGTISVGDGVTLMTFSAQTNAYTLDVNSIIYWVGDFNGSLSDCTLWDNGSFNQQTNNIYWDEESYGWLINFYNWWIPMTYINPAPSSKEYTLTCNVQTNSPNQLLQLGLYTIQYENPQNGVHFLPSTSMKPMVINNPLTIP